MNKEIRFSFSPIHNDIMCCHFKEWDYLNQVRYYHRHNACEIYLFIRGNVNYFVEQSCYHLVPGDLLIINPYEMHRVLCLDDNPYERIFINVKEYMVERLSTKETNLLSCFSSHPLGQKNLMHLSEEQMTRFISLADQLQQVLYSNEYGHDVLANHSLSQILVFINKVYQKSNHPVKNIMPKLVRDTMKYIDNHLNEPITLEQLSQNFYLSGTYISRQFKKQTGLSLRQYILDQKVEKAKAMLSEGKSVSEACYLSGFSDYANFIRSFSKTAGITPGRMKRKQAGD